MNPGDPYAAKMMNDINAAYDQIKNPPKQTTARAAMIPLPAGSISTSLANPSPRRRSNQTARHYIQMGSFQDAAYVLNQVPSEKRTAEWYYLSALVNMNLGNRVLGYEQINQACRMEPGNLEYQNVREQIERFGQVYQTQQQGFHFDMDPRQLCLALCNLLQSFLMLWPRLLLLLLKKAASPHGWEGGAPYYLRIKDRQSVH